MSFQVYWILINATQTLVLLQTSKWDDWVTLPRWLKVFQGKGIRSISGVMTIQAVMMNATVPHSKYYLLNITLQATIIQIIRILINVIQETLFFKSIWRVVSFFKFTCSILMCQYRSRWKNIPNQEKVSVVRSSHGVFGFRAWCRGINHWPLQIIRKWINLSRGIRWTTRT